MATKTVKQSNSDNVFGATNNPAPAQTEPATSLTLMVNTTTYGSALGGVFDLNSPKLIVASPDHYKKVTPAVKCRELSAEKIDNMIARGDKSGISKYVNAIDVEAQRATALKRFVEELSIVAGLKADSLVFAYIPKLLKDAITQGSYKKQIFGRTETTENSYFQAEEVALWEQFVALWRQVGDRVILKDYYSLSDKASERKSKYGYTETDNTRKLRSLHGNMENRLAEIAKEERQARKQSGVDNMTADDIGTINYFA